jgi:SAM-dependent methyltransferase
VAIKIRDYENYEKYLDHQKEKTGNPARRERLNAAFSKRETYFINRLKGTLERIHLDSRSKVVCLGSRMGEEVSAWRKLGFQDSIGTDLIANQPYVVVEDFHNLSFEDETIDIFYSNSIDHSNDPPRMFSEISRCLKASGYFIADFQFEHMGSYEACKIDNLEDAKSASPDCLEVISVTERVPTLSNQTTEVLFRKKVES